MKDAVGLIGRTVQIKETKYKIVNFYFVPGTNYLCVGLIKADYTITNYKYEDLLPYLTEQIKL